jgi:hypothetical protein
VEVKLDREEINSMTLDAEATLLVKTVVKSAEGEPFS